jgi:hypothetical protein
MKEEAMMSFQKIYWHMSDPLKMALLVNIFIIVASLLGPGRILPNTCPPGGGGGGCSSG